MFRSFYKPKRDGTRRLRPGKLTGRSLQRIVGSYPVMVDGQRTTLHPHDLRRTYARRCYDEKMDILSIRDNLGHVDHQTTLKYIGVQDIDGREPPMLYNPPHWSELENLPQQGEIVTDDDGDQEQGE